jgi:membrane protease subunit HflC
MNRNAIALLVLMVVLFVAWTSLFVVDEREIVIVTEFGEFKRSIDQPGLYWKRPWQTVYARESRIISSDSPPAEYLTLDKKRMVVDPVIRWRITDPLVFYKTVFDEAGARARLDDIINSEMRRELANHNFGEIVGSARDPMMQRVGDSARKQTHEFGIRIVDVRIKRADLPKEVQESVFARMRAERDRVAKQYRSEGEEEAAKIRAETDKEKTILLAQAYEKAQKARGDGDAQSIKIYADALGQDPEFYAFTRSLEAYEKTMNEKSSVVMSTASELFRYLRNPGQGARP